MKSTKKETKKATKKATKPTMVVDITTATRPVDIYRAFAEAKIKAGEPITMEELKACEAIAVDEVVSAIEYLVDQMNSDTVVYEDDKLVDDIISLIDKRFAPKKPWYKRFWNWVTRKNK